MPPPDRWRDTLRQDGRAGASRPPPHHYPFGRGYWEEAVATHVACRRERYRAALPRRYRAAWRRDPHNAHQGRDDNVAASRTTRDLRGRGGGPINR